MRYVIGLGIRGALLQIGTWLTHLIGTLHYDRLVGRHRTRV